jgi:putative oxidoreductase
MIRDMLGAIGLLFLRVSFGLMMLVGHGWPKLAGFAEKSEGFPDPFGVGSYTSLILAIAAEVGCSALVVLGLGTRLAAIPLAVTMGVAAFMIHANDPLFMGGGAAKEPALIYLSAFGALIFTGGGILSLDRLVSMFFNDRKVRKEKKLI